MKIVYSTNWMGPISLNWYRDRGLLAPAVWRQSRYAEDGGFWHEEILESYSAGRLDVYGLDDEEYPYGHELGVPPMRTEDWNKFSNWLDCFSTETLWTFEQLVEEYEKFNPKIRFFKDAN